jgi:hypothetical protein
MFGQKPIDPSYVQLRALCDEFQITPDKATHRLRKRKFQKTNGHWQWPPGSEELRQVRVALSIPHGKVTMPAVHQPINDPNRVYLGALCAEAGIQEDAARYRLRKANIPKREGGYHWPVGSDELERARAVLTQNARKARV